MIPHLFLLPSRSCLAYGYFHGYVTSPLPRIAENSRPKLFASWDLLIKTSLSSKKRRRVIIHNWFGKYSQKESLLRCIWETFISQFPKLTITCSPGLVIHRTENLSTMGITNFVFAYVMTQHFIRWMLCLLYPQKFTSLPSFDLNNESRALLKNFHQHQMPSRGRWCPVSRIRFLSFLIIPCC